MLFARKSRIRIGWLLLLAALFAQGAVASSGCLMPAAVLSSVIAGTSNPHCDSSMPNPNLCLVRVKDQSNSDSAQPLVAAPAPDAPLVLQPQVTVTTPTCLLAHTPFQATDPPIPIRFCSFLI